MINLDKLDNSFNTLRKLLKDDKNSRTHALITDLGNNTAKYIKPLKPLHSPKKYLCLLSEPTILIIGEFVYYDGVQFATITGNDTEADNFYLSAWSALQIINDVANNKQFIRVPIKNSVFSFYKIAKELYF